MTMVATMTARQPTATVTTSAHAGFSGKWKRWRWRRAFSAATTMQRQATMPITQLHVEPIEPSAPPPISLKLSSVSGIVLPEAIHQAAPRQTSRPPSVTMKAGTPR